MISSKRFQFLLLATAMLPFLAQAQDSGNRLLSSSLGLYVYPSESQSSEQQSKDDYECFGWAKKQTGYDPLNPESSGNSQVASQSKADGSRLRGALRGAAAGAIIGEIADDEAGKGAGIGATMGVMRAGKEKRKQQRKATAQTQEDSQQEKTEFNKAFSVCLQGRGYTVQ